MELHDLRPAEGSKKTRKRVGRGSGSGLGKTSGRGAKGQGQRSGAKVKRYKEGGQMPITRRLPKRGFHNRFRQTYQVVNVADLARIEPGDVTVETLKNAGLIRRVDTPVKILGNGEVDKAYAVKAAAFSKSAIEKLEKAGGKAEVAP